MIETIQRQLLRILCEQEFVNLYSWHQETCLSPISIANAVLALRKGGILQLSDNRENVSLTEYGRKWIELHAKDLFATKSEEPWKAVPEEMTTEGDAFFHNLFEVSDIQKLLDNINE